MNIVDISLYNSYYGLHITGDAWNYGTLTSGDVIREAAKDIIHSSQPKNENYVRFGEYISNLFETDPDKNLLMPITETCALTGLKCQIEVCLNSMSYLVLSIYMKTNGETNDTEYPCIIPMELRDLRIENLGNVTEKTFERIVQVDPWASYLKLLKNQFKKMQSVFEKPEDTALSVKEWFAILRSGLIKPNPKRRQQDIREAQHSIKRAVKLHEKFNNIDQLNKFLRDDRMVISGNYYDYHIQKAAFSIIDKTIYRNDCVCPVSMKIVDKNGKKLGGMCVYFDDTSILDHLLNVKLFASNKQTEMDMLRAGHMTETTRLFFLDPMLPQIKGILDPLEAPLHLVGNIDSHCHDVAYDSIRMAKKTLNIMAENVFLPLPQKTKQTLDNFDRARYLDAIPEEELLTMVRSTTADMLSME